MNELEFGKSLRALRLHLQMTVKEAAQKIGVPQSTYREWESGRAIRGLHYVELAKTFDVSINELFCVTDLNVRKLQECITTIQDIEKKMRSLLVDRSNSAVREKKIFKIVYVI